MTAILFEFHHMGDAVLSVPFVRAMTGKNLHVVCRSGSAQIFRNVLAEKNIHIWEPWWELPVWNVLSSLSQLRPLLKNLRSLKADQAFCVWADSRVHWLMRLSRTKMTVGFTVNRRNFYAHELPWRKRRMWIGKVMGFFNQLSHPLQRTDYHQSHLVDWQQLTKAAELPWNTETPWFSLKNRPLEPHFANPGRKTWLIHPGGRLPTKRWPVERYQLLLRARFFDSSCILIAPPDSEPLIPTGTHHISVSPKNFEELLCWIEAADAVLCNDSLVSHVAAAMGKPVWTIFGSGNPDWFAPFNNAEKVIACDICSYRPCIDRCVHSSPICLESVTVKQVIASLPATDNFI